MEQARVAFCHAFGFEYKKETDRFADLHLLHSEAAWVGFTEEQARIGDRIRGPIFHQVNGEGPDLRIRTAS
jgi:pyruvate/2-oxoglutarate dehydrogenase complex dihydrolipoamide dehydrogenase (E3) component